MAEPLYGHPPEPDKAQLDAEDQAQRRAAHARSILDDPLVVEAFGFLESHYLERLRHGSTDPKALRNARLMLQMVDEFRIQFEQVMATGSVAENAQAGREEMERYFSDERDSEDPTRTEE